MNLPLVVGGVAAAAGLTAGVIAERSSHDRHEADLDRIDQETSAWLSDANSHFADDITADRARNREMGAKLEDYKLEHPMPGELSYGRRDTNIGHGIDLPDRDGFFGVTVAGGLFGGGLVGGAVWGIASDSVRSTGSITAAAIGAGILGAGVGVAAGSAISNWTH